MNSNKTWVEMKHHLKFPTPTLGLQATEIGCLGEAQPRRLKLLKTRDTDIELRYFEIWREALDSEDEG